MLTAGFHPKHEGCSFNRFCLWPQRCTFFLHIDCGLADGVHDSKQRSFLWHASTRSRFTRAQQLYHHFPTSLALCFCAKNSDHIHMTIRFLNATMQTQQNSVNFIFRSVQLHFCCPWMTLWNRKHLKGKNEFSTESYAVHPDIMRQSSHCAYCQLGLLV